VTLPAIGIGAGRRRRFAVGDDVIIAAILFVCASMWGGRHYARAMVAGPRPFFYQSYFEPAVMTACGRGFFIAQPQPAPPALRAFLLEQTDRFSCDRLPADLRVGTEGLYQRPWRYLLTSVAVAWMVLGISWSGLAPLFGALYGITTVLVYAICRLLVGRLGAAAIAIAIALSPIHAANLPNLRDYAKAPFMLALALILIALVVRPRRTRDVLLLALGYGLAMGIGYGFRTDLLIDIPPFIVTVALFLPGGVLRSVGVKAGALALAAIGFVAAGWPIITTVVSSGGCQWHVFLLGLTTPFSDALGVSGGSYEWGHLYNDEYLWAAVSSYANRFRPDLGYIEYCSHRYDVASWEYLRQILLTFPADMATRAYASALHVVALPFQRVPLQRMPLANGVGVVATIAFVLAVGASSVRLALFAVFFVLYFGGHAAIQFLPRHYFPFEFIGWVMLAFLVERGVQWRSVARESGMIHARRALAVAALTLALLLLPLAILRLYQQRRALDLLRSYVEAPASSLALKTVAHGQLRLPVDPDAPRTAIAVMAALGRPHVRFIQAVFNTADCQPGTSVTFRYDAAYPATDFSRRIVLDRAGALVRVFEPVYTQFQGIDVSDPSPSCLRSVSIVTGLDRLPLLLPARLAAGWESQAQYQRIVSLR